MLYAIAFRSVVKNPSNPYISLFAHGGEKFGQKFTYSENYVLHIYKTFSQGINQINIIGMGNTKYDIDVILANM